MQALREAPEDGTNEKNAVSGLKKKIEKVRKTFEKPLDKRKRVCYTNQVAVKATAQTKNVVSGLRKKIEKSSKNF